MKYPKGIKSKSWKVLAIRVYCPNVKSTKKPLIPGKSMAVSANAPQIIRKLLLSEPTKLELVYNIITKIPKAKSK